MRPSISSGSASRLSSFRRFGKQHFFGVNVDKFVPYVQDCERVIPLTRPTPSEPISLRRELKDSHDDFLLAFDSPYPTQSCIYCVQFSYASFYNIMNANMQMKQSIFCLKAVSWLYGIITGVDSGLEESFIIFDTPGFQIH